MPENDQTKIERLEQLRDHAVNSVSVDGITTSFDLQAAERRQREIERRQCGTKTRKPIVSSMNLSSGLG